MWKNRNTIRYLYNEIFLQLINITQQVTQDNINEHPFRPYTDEKIIMRLLDLII